MNVTATTPVGTTAQIFGAARINLQEQSVQPVINQMMRSHALKKAMEKAPEGTEIAVAKTSLADMFMLGLKAPGEKKFKPLFGLWNADAEDSKIIADKSRILAEKVREIAVA